MRLQHQLLVGVLLAAATYFALLRIAEAKNEAAVGGRAFPVAPPHSAEIESFAVLRGRLEQMGQGDLAGRLEALRARDQLWAAPALGPERWAVFVESLSLVRRIYVRQAALRDPVSHLYPRPPEGIPPAYQAAFASLSLAGALRHELAHHDGVHEEARAYAIEIAWYEAVRGSGFLDRLQRDERRAWEWAIESALLSVNKAREKAGAGASATP